MATNLKVKMGEIGRLALALVFLNGVECHNSISKVHLRWSGYIV